MNQWFIKKFKKNKAIKMLILYPDKRIREIWAIPKGNVVQYNGYAFIVNDEDFFLSKNIPTYIYDINNVEPKGTETLHCDPAKPFSKETLNNIMGANDFDTAISARVAREIFEVSSNKMDKGTIFIIIAIVGIGITAIVGYMLSKKLDSILDIINKIKENIDIIGGF